MWPKDKLEHGWSINYDFLNQVQSFIPENESLSLEDIENVLLATEKIEVLKPSHNKQSTPCNWCKGVHAMLNHSYCSNCGRDLR
jgi:hypothetical protein